MPQKIAQDPPKDLLDGQGFCMLFAIESGGGIWHGAQRWGVGAKTNNALRCRALQSYGSAARLVEVLIEVIEHILSVLLRCKVLCVDLRFCRGVGVHYVFKLLACFFGVAGFCERFLGVEHAAF